MCEHDEPEINQRITHCRHKPEHRPIEACTPTNRQTDTTEYERARCYHYVQRRFRIRSPIRENQYRGCICPFDNAFRERVGSHEGVAWRLPTGCLAVVWCRARHMPL